MTLRTILRVLGPIDLRNVRRDALLVWIVAAPLFVILLYRFGIPPLTAYLTDAFAFDLRPYYPLIMSSFVLVAPSMIGMVIGFLVLDERDDRVLAALMVTPMPPAGYLAYRIVIPVLLGAIITAACYPLAGLVPIPPAQLAGIVLLSGFSAPITALFLAVFAENKISGFALVKILNTVNVIPVGAYFFDMPFQLAAGIVPTYWPVKMVWEAANGGSVAVYGLIGALINIIFLSVLLRRFERLVIA